MFEYLNWTQEAIDMLNEAESLMSASMRKRGWNEVKEFLRHIELLWREATSCRTTTNLLAHKEVIMVSHTYAIRINPRLPLLLLQHIAHALSFSASKKLSRFTSPASNDPTR